jgi:hypothetical protein
MTSAKKVRTNRVNAQGSTGPRTARGKSRAAQNAHRHGLSLSVISNSVLSEQAELLAQEIIGDSSDPELYQLARNIAETQLDLSRIRQARHSLLIRNIDDDSKHGMAEQLAIILSDLAKRLMLMDRYERRALSRRKFAIRAFDLACGQAVRTRDTYSKRVA